MKKEPRVGETWKHRSLGECVVCLAETFNTYWSSRGRGLRVTDEDCYFAVYTQLSNDTVKYTTKELWHDEHSFVSEVLRPVRSARYDPFSAGPDGETAGYLAGCTGNRWL